MVCHISHAGLIVALLAAPPANAGSASDLIRRGVQTLEAGEHRAARALFEKARERLPTWYLTHLYWAIAEASLRPDSPSALAAFERATELAPGNPRCHYHLGVAYNRAGRFADAETAIRRAVELRPGLADAQHQLGIALCGLGRVDEAIAELEKARTRDPDNAATLIALAQIYEEEGQLRAAVQTLRELARRRPELGEQGFVLVRFFERLGDEEAAAAERIQLVAGGIRPPPEQERFDRGKEAIAVGEIERARDLFAEARDLKRDWFMPHLYWGIAEASLAPKSPTGLAALERAAAMAPSNPLCHYHLGVALGRAGRYSHAEESLRRAIAMRPGLEDARFQLGLVIRHQGRRHEAIRELEAARAEAGDRPATLAALAELFEEEQSFVKAEQTLRELTRLPAANGVASSRLLAFLERIGAADGQAEERRRLEELETPWPPERELLWRGVDMLAAGELEQAREVFAQARQQAPGWFMTHLYWAIAEARIKPESAAALAALEQAVSLVPYNPRCHYEIGLIHQHAKRYTEAETSLRRALELRPGVQDARFQLAVLLREQGRKAEALAELERARTETPGHLATLATLAEIYEQDERYREAEDALVQITRLQPAVASHHSRLADFLERTGQPAEARRIRRRVEALDPRPKRRMRPLPPARR